MMKIIDNIENYYESQKIVLEKSKSWIIKKKMQFFDFSSDVVAFSKPSNRSHAHNVFYFRGNEFFCIQKDFHD